MCLIAVISAPISRRKRCNSSIQHEKPPTKQTVRLFYLETVWYIGHPCTEINTRELQKPETLRSKRRNLKHVPFWSGLEINSSAGQHGAVPRTCTNSKKSLLYRTCEGGKGNRLQCVLNYMTWATLLPFKNGWTTRVSGSVSPERGDAASKSSHSQWRQRKDTHSTWAKAQPLDLCEEPHQDTGGAKHTAWLWAQAERWRRHL